MPMVIKNFIKSGKPLWSNTFVLDLAESMALSIQDEPGFHKVVVLFDGPYQERDQKKALKQAAKVWRERNNGKYESVFGDYDGFKAK